MSKVANAQSGRLFLEIAGERIDLGDATINDTDVWRIEVKSAEPHVTSIKCAFVEVPIEVDTAAYKPLGIIDQLTWGPLLN